jgi:hypothetical protein
MLMLSVPSPVMPEIVTVRVAVPEPDTATVAAAAVPLALTVTFASVNETLSAFAYVTTKSTGPPRVTLPEGAPMDALGSVLLTRKVVLVGAAGAVLPAASVAVPDAMEIASVPSPVMEPMLTVRCALPLPETLTTPFALPVFTRVMFPAARPTVLAPVYDTV